MKYPPLHNAQALALDRAFTSVACRLRLCDVSNRSASASMQRPRMHW
jgi:hypothetical protein